MSKLFSYPEAKQVVVSGDIHGDFNGLVFKLCVQYELTDTVLIVAGDCGFGFELEGYYEQIYNSIAKRLRKANNWIVFIRGNHDNPAYFNEQIISYKRWRCVPDYSVIQACGHNILCVGGAVSIDRQRRIEDNARRMELGHKKTSCWWPDEAPVYDEDAIDFLPAEVQIDTVVSHSAPSFCRLNEHRHLRSWAEGDPTLLDDVTNERKALDQVHKHLLNNDHPVTRWFYGHFHQSWYGMLDGIQYSMLDIMEFKEMAEVQ